MYTFKDGKKMQISQDMKENYNPAVAMRNQVMNRMLASGATGTIGPGGQQTKKPWYKHWYIILIIVLVIAAIAGGLIYMSHRSRINKSKTTRPAFGYYF